MSHADGDQAPRELAQVVRFLRALAERAERDPRFASTLLACLEESGLFTLATSQQAGVTPRRSHQARETRATRSQALDPFVVWRTQGEDALRRALDGLDLMELRAVIKAHRFDPARVASRWTARDRVIALILEQVKARMNHGRAFERV
jgi:hypothetical protein